MFETKNVVLQDGAAAGVGARCGRRLRRGHSGGPGLGRGDRGATGPQEAEGERVPGPGVSCRAVRQQGCGGQL